MQKFTTVTAIAAPIPIDNIDTDMIIPKQFLTTIKRSGLGENLFYEMRYDENGIKQDDFLLHQAPFNKAQILLSGDNFGCGSSREHAPWALLDFGFRCVIAESFADIFYNNMFKNSLLPIVQPKEAIAKLMEYAKTGATISVDLEQQKIIYGDQSLSFDIDASRKEALLTGKSDIGETLESLDAIEAFEAKHKELTPWL